MTERLRLAPLPRQTATFSEQAASVLREMILSGQLRMGDRVNEVEIAAGLGISRAPLREAIQALANEGLIVTIPNRGALVRSFSEGELADLYELRIALELRALALANERASPADLNDVQALLDETDDRMASSPARAYPGELDFHRRLVALSRSNELAAAASSVDQRISLARSRSGHEPARARHAFGQHREILAMLRTRDLVAATELLTRHLTESLDNALIIFRQDSASG